MATPHGVHLNWATVTEGGFHVNVERQALLERERRLLRAGAEGHRQPGNVAWAIWDERSDAIAMQQASHKEAKRRGRHQALRLGRGRRARRRLRSEGAGADLRRRRRRAARREEGRVRPRLHAQAAAQAAVLRLEDRGRAHAHPGRARGEHADARAAQGRHAAAEPLRRRRRRARTIRAVGLGLSFRLRPDDRHQHGPPRRHCRSQTRQRITMIKFYYSTAPNPMKVALCLEEMGLAYEPIPGGHAQGRATQARLSGDQPQRQGALHRGWRGDGIRQQRHRALSRREDRQVPAEEGGGARADALVADVRRLGHRAVHRPVRALQELRAGENRLRFPAATSSKRCATGASWTRAWRRTSIWLAILTRSSTWRCGAGHG